MNSIINYQHIPDKKLISVRVTNKLINEMSQAKDPETCSICLDDVLNNGKVKLSCGHEFHLKCYIELQVDGGANKKACPNCRSVQDIPTVAPRPRPQPRIVVNTGNENPDNWLLRLFNLPNLPQPRQPRQPAPRQPRQNVTYRRNSIGFHAQSFMMARPSHIFSIIEVRRELIHRGCHCQNQSINTALSKMIRNGTIQRTRGVGYQWGRA